MTDFRKALNLGEVNDMAERLMKALLIIDKQQATIADQARTIDRLTVHLGQKSRQIDNLQNTVAHYQEGKTDA